MARYSAKQQYVFIRQIILDVPELCPLLNIKKTYAKAAHCDKNVTLDT